MMSSLPARRSGNGYRIALWTLVLLSALAQRLWIARNQAPPELLDDADHLIASLSLYQTLSRQGLAPFVKDFVHTASHYYHPPLVPALTAPFYALFGQSVAAALWINTLFLVLFFVYLFKLVGRWAGDGPAWTAVAVTALFPMTYGLARIYLLEFGLAAVVVIWLFYFYDSDALARARGRPGLLLLGLLLGAGLLVKATFPIYIVGPVIWEILSKARADFRAVRPMAGRLLIVIAIGGLLALPWYWYHGDWVWMGAHYISGDLNRPAALKAALAWSPLLSFWRLLLTEGTSTYFFVAGLVLLAFFIGRRRSWPRHAVGFLLAWWIPPFLICSFMSEKVGRYLFPAFPALAALIGLLYGSLVRPNSAPLRRALIGALFFLIPLGNFFQLSFFDVWPRGADVGRPTASLSLLDPAGGHEFSYRPRSQRWPLDIIVQILQVHTAARPPKEIRGSIYFTSYPLIPANLIFSGMTRNVSLVIYPLLCGSSSVRCCLQEDNADREFLIVERPTAYWFELEDALDDHSTPYRALATVPLPPSGESQVVIYKRNPAPPEGRGWDDQTF